jgi:hypothetical protein
VDLILVRLLSYSTSQMRMLLSVGKRTGINKTYYFPLKHLHVANLFDEFMSLILGWILLLTSFMVKLIVGSARNVQPSMNLYHSLQ